MPIISSLYGKKFLQQLQKHQNKNRAAEQKCYHKSEREHWGIVAADCNRLVRQYGKELAADDLAALSKQLWKTDLFDPMICAAKMLAIPKIKPSQSLWKQLCQFLKQVDGWALEDTLAHAAWKCLLADETLLDEVEKWTESNNLWMRRAALVYTLPFAKPGRNPERMLCWVSLYADDREWFIQKAIGWWLRVLGEHNPKRVLHFLEAHEAQLMTVAKREATRKLSICSGRNS